MKRSHSSLKSTRWLTGRLGNCFSTTVGHGSTLDSWLERCTSSSFRPTVLTDSSVFQFPGRLLKRLKSDQLNLKIEIIWILDGPDNNNADIGYLPDIGKPDIRILPKSGIRYLISESELGHSSSWCPDMLPDDIGSESHHDSTRYWSRYRIWPDHDIGTSGHDIGILNTRY